jgi:hypothetical protein
MKVGFAVVRLIHANINKHSGSTLPSLSTSALPSKTLSSQPEVAQTAKIEHPYAKDKSLYTTSMLYIETPISGDPMRTSFVLRGRRISKQDGNMFHSAEGHACVSDVSVANIYKRDNADDVQNNLL